MYSHVLNHFPVINLKKQISVKKCVLGPTVSKFPLTFEIEQTKRLKLFPKKEK